MQLAEFEIWALMLPNRILHYKQGKLCFHFRNEIQTCLQRVVLRLSWKLLTQNIYRITPKEGTGSVWGMRSSGVVGIITRISLSPCLPRDSTTLTWLYHFSSREDLAVNFICYHLHSTLCTNAMRPGLSAAALHQEKRRHSFASKGHKNCLSSAAKKVLEVLGGRKKLSALSTPAIKSCCKIHSFL